MDNPFVYGEVVPAAAFVDRVARARPAHRATCSPGRRSSSSRRAATASPRSSSRRSAARAARGPDRRGHGQQLTARTWRSSRATPARCSSPKHRPDRVRAWLAELLGSAARRKSATSAGRAGAVGLLPRRQDEGGRRPARRGRVRASRPASRSSGAAGSSWRSTSSRRSTRSTRGATGRARAARRRPAPARGRVRLRGLRADADGADARAEAARSTRPGR